MLRAVLMVVLVGCGFQIAVTPGDGAAASDGAPGDGAPRDGVSPPDASPDAPPDAPPPRDCGPAYVTVPAASATTTYRKVNTGASWASASAACQADGAHLIIPDTTAEATAVFAFVAPASISPFYWIGVRDPENDGSWTTVLGRVVASPPWATNQPSNSGGDDSVLVDSAGRWYDFNNNATQEYACECPP